VYRDIPQELRELIEPVIESYELELVDVEFHRGRAPWRLRVIVDTPEGDGRVLVDRCAEVSRELGTHLDARDAIPARYHLEVSSPGLARVLGRAKDFEAVQGSEVRVETRRPLSGRRRFQGRLVAVEGEGVRLEVEKSEVAIAFAEMAKASKVYHFTREDFSSRGGH
jgi:ribosome maturation factor RimP